MIISLMFVLMTICGCFKYSFTGKGGPGHISSVAIPLFENSTAEYGIVEDLTDELILTFQNDNTLKIADESSADAVLWGKLTRVEDVPYTYEGEGEAANFSVGEYKLTLTVEIEYYDLVKEETLWKQQVQGWGTYNYVSGSQEERVVGFSDAIEKLTQDILNLTVSGW
ncbi:hypothetical protein KKA00_11245 [bacterium]|nr:hypothetical protein [bacterium]